jgi:hypothetical protein
VGTDWTQAERHLREHLDAQGFADVQLDMGMRCAATRLALDNPWIDWALASMQASTGKPASLLPNLAGSCPTTSLPRTWACPRCGCRTPTRPAPSTRPTSTCWPRWRARAWP